MICGILLLVVAAANAFQLVEELCETTRIAELVPGWCSDDVPRCEWKGVTCDNKGEFTELELRDVPLNVQLPNKIDAPGLYCRKIAMVNCGLTGEVPPTIELAKFVYAIDLSHNQLTGNLPWKWIARMGLVNFSFNKLSGAASLTSHQGKFKYLHELHISNNAFYENLDGLTTEKMPALNEFDISNNNFFGQAPKLENVRIYNISGNHFSHIAGDELDPTNDVRDREREYEPNALRICDTFDNPFRLPPPQWLAGIHDKRCRYSYDPSNRLYFEKDFTTKETTTASVPLN